MRNTESHSQRPRRPSAHPHPDPASKDFSLDGEDLEDESAEALRGFLLSPYTRPAFEKIISRLVRVERKSLLTNRLISEEERHASQGKLEIMRSMMSQMYAAIGERTLPKHILEWFE